MENKKSASHWPDVSYLPLIISAIVTVGITYLIYNQTQSILKERLQERLTAIASTAALQFEASDIREIQLSKNKQDPILKKVIAQMRKIRDANQNLKYIYIWSQTGDPNNVAFTADAEMLQPIDRDNNGKIDGIEIPPEPGENYDVSDIPVVQKAFQYPIAADEFLIDKWGAFLSGFAPIKDEKNMTVAIIGMDVEIGDYFKLTRATLVPFALLAGLLLCMLTIQTISLIRIWKSRIEIVQELDKQKDELLSMVSHQLAAPITALKWYLELFIDSGMNSLVQDQKEAINNMQSVTLNLSELVSMILDVSRIQLGRVRVDREEINIHQLITDIMTVVEPKAREKKIRLILDLPKQQCLAILDKKLTRISIENLLTNAIKYTPESGKVTVNMLAEGNTIKMIIKDTGYGIPENEQSKIFGKLYRASNVRNKIEGNGFGLYLVKSAIESQGGKIAFTSKEGLGTTFSLELPIK